jgi:hypothetical protein
MPARPRGLLEPCAATSGKHGSEEGGAGKRHPLSDNKNHYVRDTVWREDDNQAYTGHGPQSMAALRNLAMGLFRLNGIYKIKEATECISRDRNSALPLLATQSNHCCRK